MKNEEKEAAQRPGNQMSVEDRRVGQLDLILNNLPENSILISLSQLGGKATRTTRSPSPWLALHLHMFIVMVIYCIM
jgi:hypothetical protein